MLAGRINPGQLKSSARSSRRGDGGRHRRCNLRRPQERLHDRPQCQRHRDGDRQCRGTSACRRRRWIPLLGDEGTDTLKNIEIVRFTTRDAAGLPNGTTDVFIGRATGAVTITGTQNVLTADRSGIVDVNGLPGANGFSYRWETPQTVSTDGRPRRVQRPGRITRFH